jgi:hypothetical protein
MRYLGIFCIAIIVAGGCVSKPTAYPVDTMTDPVTEEAPRVILP